MKKLVVLIIALAATAAVAKEVLVVRFKSFEFTTPEQTVRVQITPDNRIHVYVGESISDLNYIGTRYDFCEPENGF